MKVSEIGQFGLIDLIDKLIAEARDDRVESWKNLVAGIGDDCAVWHSEPADQLAKVDCQVQGVHFTLETLSWEDLGWKSLAVNLSDIAAMGGIPRYALVSLGLPPDTEVENVLSFYQGLILLSKITGTAVVGGNVSGSPNIFVDVNVLGRVGNTEGKYLSRSAARPRDQIAVTGWLGTAAAGLKMLSEKREFNPGIAACLKQAFSRPEPRLTEGRLLVEKGVKAGMDISDGLLADLGHMCRASHVSAVVRLSQLPIRPEVSSVFQDQSQEMALSGGEDYQLLFTAPANVIEKVRQAAAYPVTVIGEITAPWAETIALMDSQGLRSLPEVRGWDHFKHK